MGVAGLPYGYLPCIPKTDIFDCDILCCSDGVMVYVYFNLDGTHCRSVSLCSGMRRGMDETDGLLYAERE